MAGPEIERVVSVGRMNEPQPGADAATPDGAGVVPDAPSGPDAPADATSGATGAAHDAFERRAFVRRMSGDAVRTASTVFGLSRMLTRSAAAAGQAVMGELEAIQVGNAGQDPLNLPSGDASAPVGPPAIAAAPEIWPAVPPVQPPELLLDADQRAILEEAASAIVAVNRDGHPPQLTAAKVLWDGDTLRFATLGWSRRTTMLRADPRISLLIEGAGDGRFVTVTGRARIVEGREARDAALPLISREVGDDPSAAEARWQELTDADADRAVIVIEPEQVLSGRR
jgi:nitroimidazol reductase NimA-like FMN-containing flavoprotein (pyridoxamine 5'-phosphate oxidase superfamily)